MAVGVFHLRNSSEPAATVVRAGSVDGFLPVENAASTPPAVPTEAALGPISLADIVRQLKSRPTTSTTRARPTTTTTRVKRAAPSTTTPATTTTTAAAGATPSPTTTTTVAGTPLTTLVEKVVSPAAAAVTGAVTKSDSGVASWFRAPAGTCAHRTLPMGTRIKVTRVHTGASATCKVDDRGPTAETGRLIDLSLDTFEKLAHREVGLIDVKIEW